MDSKEMEKNSKEINERLTRIEKKVDISQDYTWAVGFVQLMLTLATFGIGIMTGKIYYTGFTDQVDIYILGFLVVILWGVVFLFGDIIGLLVKYKQWFKQRKGISVSDTNRFLRRFFRKKQ